MREIRVLHTEWSTGWGGQEMRIISEILALQKNYNVKSFIATKKEAQIAKIAQKHGIEVVFFPFKSSFDLKSIFGIAKFAKEHNIDIINTHSGKDTWIGWLSSVFAKTKFIRTRHIGNIINPNRLNFVNSCADFIITTGEQIRLNFIKFNRINPQKIKSIPTGIDESIFDASKYDKTAAKTAFSLSQNKIIVGNIGLFREVKRLDLFLQIALKIHENYPNVEFALAGDGDVKEKITKFIADNEMQGFVKLLPFSDEPWLFLKAIDIFMLTSSSEGVPQSLMQALFMQKACIATNVGSVKDLHDGSNFLLCPCDFSELYNSLKELLDSTEKLNFLKQNEQKFVRENFSLKKMSDEIYKIYNLLLNPPESINSENSENSKLAAENSETASDLNFLKNSENSDPAEREQNSKQKAGQ